MFNKRKFLFLMIIVFIISFLILYVYKEKEADKQDKIISLQLEQAEGELLVEVQENSTNQRLSEMEDINTLIKPTKLTYKIIERWKIVHEVDPKYPYPEKEIKEKDWFGIVHFLYGEIGGNGGAKAEMVYDEYNRIDYDIYEFIMYGNTDSSKPEIKEIQKLIDN